LFVSKTDKFVTSENTDPDDYYYYKYYDNLIDSHYKVMVTTTRYQLTFSPHCLQHSSTLTGSTSSISYVQR